MLLHNKDLPELGLKIGSLHLWSMDEAFKDYLEHLARKRSSSLAVRRTETEINVNSLCAEMQLY